jgi:hypothetical protein
MPDDDGMNSSNLTPCEPTIATGHSLADYITPRPIVVAAVSTLTRAADVPADGQAEVRQERHQTR